MELSIGFAIAILILSVWIQHHFDAAEKQRTAHFQQINKRLDEMAERVERAEYYAQEAHRNTFKFDEQ